MSSYTILSFKGAELPENYIGMVKSQFLFSLRHDNKMFKLIDPKSYYAAYPQYVMGLLKRPHTIIKIAALTDDPDVSLGWAMIERNMVHYIYVPPAYRRTGIAKDLLSEPFTRFSHITNLALIIWNAKFAEAKFDPFLLGEQDDCH